MVTVEENDQTPPSSEFNKEIDNELHIASLNVRTLLAESRLSELIHGTKDVKWDILGLCEVRRDKELIEEHHDFILYHSTATKGLRGVGFLIKKHLKKCINKFQSFSDRVALIEIKLGMQNIWTIIEAYAPTEKRQNNEALEDFYDTLEKAIVSSEAPNLIIMGDFNAQVGIMQAGEESIFGRFSRGKRSNHGAKLVQFALENNLKIANTMYARKKNRKWTWKSPNEKVFNEIDYILTNKPKQVKNFDVINPNFFTDHRIVRCKLNTKFKRKINVNKLQKIRIIPKIPDEEKDQLKLRFERKLEDKRDAHNRYTTLQNEVNCVIKEIGLCKTKQREELTKATAQLLEERKQLYRQKQTKEVKRKITSISKEINRKIKRDKKQRRQEIFQKHIKKSGAVKKAFKELSNKKEWTANIKTKRKTLTARRPCIIQEATRYYEELYATNETLELNNDKLEETEQSKTLPNILKSEIERAVVTQKDDKAPGDDHITNEALKALMEPLLTSLQVIFDDILANGTTPDEWSKSTTILLHKKGDRSDLGNYRPISLMSNMYKIFSKIILNRISATLDQNQPQEQAGFRKGYSTIDHIQVVSTIINKYREYHKTLYVGFIDYAKAFDSLEHSSIWMALRQNGIEEGYIQIIKNIYASSSAKIRMERDGDEFPIRKGVRQGDPLSPKIFCSVLEMIFKNIGWQNEGILINGEYLSHLRFADDLVVFSESAKNLETMIRDIARESGKIGLRINASKTKIMTNGLKQDVIVENEIIEYVDEYTYLGQSISFEDLTEKEIDRRIGLAWKKYWSLKEIMKSKDIHINIKSKVYNVAILPCLIYGCQTWALRKADENKLAICQRKMERSMLGIKLSDKISNKKIRKKTKIRDIITAVRLLKWNWAGHICRMDTNRWTKKVTEWLPREERRQRGRPKRRWDDVFTHKYGQEWRRMARDRKLWSQLGEAYAKEATST